MKRVTKAQEARFGVVLPAGGLGLRVGGVMPKQLIEIEGRPLYRYCLETFLAHPRVQCVVLVVPADWRSHFELDLQDLDEDDLKKMQIVEGGVDRWLSVRKGVESLPKAISHVLVHDVARPFIDHGLIDAVLERVQKSACIVAKPATDTIKLVENGLVLSTVDRSKVWLAQTPQACALNLLCELYHKMDSAADGNATDNAIKWTPTDEASILEHFGIEVAVVQGAARNDKVTTALDLLWAEREAQQWKRLP